MYTTATTTVGCISDPKFTVADILTSMASGGADLPSPGSISRILNAATMWQSQGQHMQIQNAYNDNNNGQIHNGIHQNVQYNGQNMGHNNQTWFSEASFMSSIPTGNTPTLTPTTLANIEQTFIELQSTAPVTIAPVGDPSRQSGFVPPVVDPRATSSNMTVKTEYSDYYDMDDSHSSDQDWMPVAKRSRPDNNNQGQTSVISFAQTLSQDGSPSTSTATHRKTPGRRGKNDVLPPEEDAKRRLRRERNKLAAAKCRQRRVDHTNVLIGETEELEEKRASLENEIQQLQQQKEQLEFLLQAHKPVCTVVKLQIKPDPEDQSGEGATNRASSNNNSADRTRFSPSQSQLVATSRPTTLPLSVQSLAAGEAGANTQARGIVVSTPSNGQFAQLGLDSMRDGHTGLTPITGAPSGCAREVRNSSDSSPSDGIASPTRLMAL